MSAVGPSDELFDFIDLEDLGELSEQDIEEILASIEAISENSNPNVETLSPVQTPSMPSPIESTPPYNPFYSIEPLSSSPTLTFHYDENTKKRGSDSQSLSEKSDLTKEEMDNKVLAAITALKKRHSAVNDDSVTNYLNIDEATLNASKKRLQEKNYLSKNGRYWHRITEVGKEYMAQWKEETPMKKRVKAST